MSGFADFQTMRSLENSLANLGERGSVGQAVAGGVGLVVHRQDGQQGPAESLFIEAAL